MIDIHSHILPGVDDGAMNIEESLEMASMAAESGVDYIVATPHCNIPGVYDNYLGPSMKESLVKLRRAVNECDIPIRVVAGMEIFVTPELPDLFRKKKLLTLNGTRYFLTEFDFSEDMQECDKVLKECKSLGFIPVIAHPERYYFIQEYPEYVFEWLKQGYGIQVNKGSILGRFGRAARRTADILLEQGMISCVASDAHSSYQRTPFMGEIYDYLMEEYGPAYTQVLLENNPKRILAGKELVKNWG